MPLPQQEAQEVHELIRRLITEMYGPETAGNLTIQYGGSAKPANTAELLAEPDVDGLLVGGPVWKAEDFAAMVKTAAAIKNNLQQKEPNEWSLRWQRFRF